MSDAYLPGDTRQRIQDLIKDRKITQAELAENVGLSNSALSRYLQGNTKNLAMVLSFGSPSILMFRQISYLGKRIFRTGRIMILRSLVSRQKPQSFCIPEGQCLHVEPVDRASSLSAATSSFGTISG